MDGEIKMEMNEVLYEGKLYAVIYKYTSGYLEIREKSNRFHIELVHESDVQNVSEMPYVQEV